MIKRTFFKIASVFALAICFYSASFAQLTMRVQTYTCDENTYYLQLGKAENIRVEDNTDTLYKAFDTFKVRGKKLLIDEQNPQLQSFTIIPKAVGKTLLKVKIRLKNGQKITLTREFEIVALPELCMELSVSSPDHKFIWLKIREESTGKDVSNDYRICMMEYTLRNSQGAIKEEGVIASDQWFFPSISLRGISAKFEIGDELIITTSMIHQKYNLLNYVEPTVIVIDKLWN